MNWLHEPLISPAVGAYCLLGVIVFGGLCSLIQRERKQPPAHDPHAQPYGDQ